MLFEYGEKTILTTKKSFLNLVSYWGWWLRCNFSFIILLIIKLYHPIRLSFWSYMLCRFTSQYRQFHHLEDFTRMWGILFGGYLTVKMVLSSRINSNAFIPTQLSNCFLKNSGILVSIKLNFFQAFPMMNPAWPPF